MQSHYSEYQSIEASEAFLEATANFANPDDVETEAADTLEPVRFHGEFEDCMEMYADAATVAEYLQAHQAWFSRCAHPMKVQTLGQNGYALTIGRFGSFGYEVEPKVGLELLPPDEQGVYRIHTIPIPDYTAPGYDVDFNASLQLVELTPEQLAQRSDIPTNWAGKVTGVEWQLDLVVSIHFPRFIYRLPKSLIQTTGDRLICQIVRQVSRCLTRKVQNDFHTTSGLSLPSKARKKLF